MENLLSNKNIQTIKTRNNFRVILDHCTHTEAVSFSITIQTGTCNEQKKNNGISHFLEHVTFRKKGNSKIAEIFDNFGGRINAFTVNEYTCYYGKVLPENFLSGFISLLEHVYYPEFNENDVEIERNIIIEEINQYKDNLPEQVKINALSHIFPNHPLSFDILGTRASLKNIHKQELYEYHQNYYYPENSVITISGNLKKIDLNKVITLIEEMNLTSKTISNSTIIPIFRHGYNKDIKKEVGQSHIFISYPSFSKQEQKHKIVGLILINALLTGIKSSVLKDRIRERRGLVYSIYSYPSFYSNLGLFNIYTATSSSTEEKVLNIIQNEIRNIISSGFDENMMIPAKNRLKSEFVFNLEKLEDRMIFWGRKEILNEHYFDNFLKTVDSITLKQVNEYVKQIFNNEPSIYIISRS